LYDKFLTLKPDFKWDKPIIQEKLFTKDVALMMGDVEIIQMADEYNLHCDIFINPGKYLAQSAMAFAFQKDFALKEIIDFQLLKLKQTGLLKKLATKYFKEIPQDCATEPIRELSFQETLLSFGILASGILVALCSLLAEQVRLLFTRKKQQAKSTKL